MVAAINEIGHVTGIETVAEGVISEAILKQIRALGLDYAQGFSVQKPQPQFKI